MTLNMTRDEFHEVIMTYLINLAEEKGNIINEGNLVYTPIFDEMLQFLKNKSLPSKLKMSYNNIDGKSKLKYRRFMSKIENTREVVLYL